MHEDIKSLAAYMIVVRRSHLCAADVSFKIVRVASLFPQASDAEPNAEKCFAHTRKQVVDCKFSAFRFAARFRKICKNNILRLLGIPPKLILPAFFNLRTCCVPEDPSITSSRFGP